MDRLEKNLIGHKNFAATWAELKMISFDGFLKLVIKTK